MKARDYSRCVRLSDRQIVALAKQLPDATDAQVKRITDKIVRGWYGEAKLRKPKRLKKKT